MNGGWESILNYDINLLFAWFPHIDSIHLNAPAVLSAKDLEKYSKFHRVGDRNRFILSREIVNFVFRYEDLPYKLLSATTGQPFIVTKGANSDIYCSITHSNEFVGVGLSRSLPLGVDIEFIASPIDHLLRPYLFNAHYQYPENKLNLRDYYQIWSIFESFLKCTSFGWNLGDKLINVDPFRIMNGEGFYTIDHGIYHTSLVEIGRKAGIFDYSCAVTIRCSKAKEYSLFSRIRLMEHDFRSDEALKKLQDLGMKFYTAQFNFGQISIDTD